MYTDTGKECEWFKGYITVCYSELCQGCSFILLHLSSTTSATIQINVLCIAMDRNVNILNAEYFLQHCLHPTVEKIITFYNSSM